jgi:DNA-binding NtrC family response regulator
MENLMERAYILEESSTLCAESFPSELFQGEAEQIPVSMNTNDKLAEARRRAIDDFERQYLKDLLSRNKGKMNQSADDAGISTRQLHKLLIKYGLKKEEFRNAQL